MTGYGFKKSQEKQGVAEMDTIDLSGITRVPVELDPRREASAIERANRLGYVDREGRGFGVAEAEEAVVRRRRKAVPQGNLYIKGPREILDWFVEYTNRGGHRSYWEALEELRRIAEHRARSDGD